MWSEETKVERFRGLVSCMIVIPHLVGVGFFLEEVRPPWRLLESMYAVPLVHPWAALVFAAIVFLCGHLVTKGNAAWLDEVRVSCSTVTIHPLSLWLLGVLVGLGWTPRDLSDDPGPIVVLLMAVFVFLWLGRMGSRRGWFEEQLAPEWVNPFSLPLSGMLLTLTVGLLQQYCRDESFVSFLMSVGVLHLTVTIREHREDGGSPPAWRRIRSPLFRGLFRGFLLWFAAPLFHLWACIFCIGVLCSVSIPVGMGLQLLRSLE